MNQGIPNYRQYYNKLEPLVQRQDIQTYSGLILFLLTTSFFVVFAIKPTLNTITSLNKEIEDAKLTDKKLQDKINALSLAQSEYNKVSNDLPLIYSVLPNNPQVTKYVQLIEASARASGVKISSFQVSPIDLYVKPGTDKADTGAAGKTTSGLEEHTFNLFVTGDYKSLTNFEQYLRKIQRLTLIKTLAVNKAGNQSGDNTLGNILSGKVFILK